MSPYPWRKTNLEAAAFDMDGTLLDSAGFGATHVALDRQDARHEVVGRSGQACPAPVAIENPIDGEGLAGLAPGTAEQGLVAKGEWLALRGEGNGGGLRLDVVGEQGRPLLEGPVGYQSPRHWWSPP